MPAVSAPAKILVTGANGYIGIYIVQYLLERGFKVRGSVRTASKGEYVKNLFPKYSDNFEYVIVPDVNKVGAYDEAVKGVDAIESIAAPMPNEVEHPDLIVKPAVEGSIALLESARKAGTVKRVIITSTIYAILGPKEGPYHYTESDWNEQPIEAMKSMGAKTPAVVAYAASKVLLERAVTDYVKKHDGSLNFDVVFLLPTFVFGPPSNDLGFDSFSSIGAFLTGLTDPSKVPGWFAPDSLVDVRDVAELHVRAVVTESAANKRFNLISGTFTWAAAYEALLDKSVKPKFSSTLESAPADVLDSSKTISNERSRSTFGFTYRTLQETVRDSWVEFAKRGWIDAEGKSTVA